MSSESEAVLLFRVFIVLVKSIENIPRDWSYSDAKGISTSHIHDHTQYSIHIAPLTMRHNGLELYPIKFHVWHHGKATVTIMMMIPAGPLRDFRGLGVKEKYEAPYERSEQRNLRIWELHTENYS